MSMLAEPRRKQKWTLNPRGKQWSDDSNKFGQKMLEKMGWSSGKGLGANEQGMTEHVRVSFKNDMSGIGFKKDNLDKAWTEHQDSFNDFLQQLQQDESHNVVKTEENKGALSGKSLELKSKQSRARVHYQKFTRGKDVNKYSSKDLANIFGQKELNLNKIDKDKKDIQVENVESVGTQDNRGGVITINGGNMVDYFMKKAQDFSPMSKGKKREKSNSESEPEYAGFGFASTLENTSSYNDTESKESRDTCNYAFENPCVQLDSPENVPNTNKGCKSSKKRKSFDDEESSLSNKAKKIKEEITNENSCKNGIVNAALNLDCQTEEVCDGKEFEVSRVEFGVANSALDLSDEVDCKKRVTFNDHVEYSTDPMKKKKGRTMLDKFEVENKKSRKKKKHNDISNSVASGFVNEALDVAETSEEVNDNEINESKSRTSKKKKGARRSNLETIVEIPEEDKVCEDVTESKRNKPEEDNVQLECVVENDIPIKKKKKKKDKDKIEIVLIEDKDNVKEIKEEEIVFEANATLEKEECEIQEDQVDISKRKKKNKKKNKEKDIESNIEKSEKVTSEIETEVAQKENVEKEKMDGETVKVKKKKKSKKDDTNDVSNEVSMIDEKEISDKENTKDVDEIEVKESKRKKHRKQENESVNDNFTHSAELTEHSVKESNIVENNRCVPSKSSDNRRLNNSSPWNHRAKMSKRLLISLFNRNSIKNFPGSNINEIKGYGADVQ